MITEKAATVSPVLNEIIHLSFTGKRIICPAKTLFALCVFQVRVVDFCSTLDVPGSGEIELILFATPFSLPRGKCLKDIDGINREKATA